MNKKPFVSIFMMVYNHENYIRKAIDGILIQKTNFEFEIVVGEDCSTDNSRNILLEYKLRYPEKFKLLLHKKNIGPPKNHAIILENCSGKYVAFCEGDDYWIDPLKLQKQVDIMEADTSVSLVYTNCEEKYENAGRSNKIKYDVPMPEGDCISDIIKGSFPQTVSVVCRNSFFPNNISNLIKPNYKMGDYPMVLHLAYLGKTVYMPEVTCVYRKNEDSISGSVAKNYIKNINFISSCREVLNDFKIEKKISDPVLLQKIDAQLQHWLLTSFSMSLQNHNLSLAKELWIEIKQNSTPIPIKYKILNLSTAFGIFGKWLINFYYKK